MKQHLHECQAHALSGNVLDSGPAEGLEDLVHVLLRDPAPVVPHPENGRTVRFHRRHLDVRGPLRVHVFDGIVQQVPEDLFDGGAVAGDPWQRADLQYDVAALDLVC